MESTLVATSKFQTVEPENTYSCILKEIGQFWESQKRVTSTLITATTSVHIPKSVSTDVQLKIQFYPTQ